MQYLNCDMPQDLKQVLAKVIEMALDDVAEGIKPQTGKAIAHRLGYGVRSRRLHLPVFRSVYMATREGIRLNEAAQEEVAQRRAEYSK
jgi:hypothetical protein